MRSVKLIWLMAGIIGLITFFYANHLIDQGCRTMKASQYEQP